MPVSHLLSISQTCDPNAPVEDTQILAESRLKELEDIKSRHADALKQLEQLKFAVCLHSSLRSVCPNAVLESLIEARVLLFAVQIFKMAARGFHTQQSLLVIK